MHIQHATLETCSDAIGTVVVIDVWRSFTTAAFAFAAGARDILVAGSTEEALALKARFPDTLLMGMGDFTGEVAKGFDFGNSPSKLAGLDWRGRRVVQCTPNGTRGLARSMNAEMLLASSFVCAQATLRAIRQQPSADLTLASTEDDGVDKAYADYLAALVRGESPDATVVFKRLRAMASEYNRALLSGGRVTKPQVAVLEADLDCCLALDRFDFALHVQRRDGLLVMEAWRGVSLAWPDDLA
jgi:2-phosphosulfolactate phosphatase